jgi:predicted metal-dependent enzyme (double-stranded beta helix superfamily)
MLKVTQRLLAALVVNFAVVLPLCADTGAVIDIQNEPHHHVVFENSLIRILEVTIEPGTSTLFHRHSRDNFAVYLADVTTANQPEGQPQPDSAPHAAGSIGFAAGDAKPYVHRVVNTGSSAVHLLDVELKLAADHRTGSASSAAPVPIDNDRIRGYTISLGAGQSSAPIELGPGVLVVMPGSAIEQTKSGGKSERVSAGGPRWRWRPAGSYVLKNRSGATALAVEVEIK